jgi:hypothetical protein
MPSLGTVCAAELERSAPQKGKTVIENILMMVSAGIILMLGVIHLIYTFWGRKLTPRDPNLKTSMTHISPVISSETTMWKAWVGFNASHSFGAILFGLIYGYLAMFKAELLFKTPFLLALGFSMLGGLVVIGRLYWFSVPFRSLCVSLAFYVASVAISWMK